VIDFKNRKLFTGAALGAMVLAGAGGYWARASAENGAVNIPAAASPAASAPMSFADIVQRVAPAVVSIEVEGKVGPSQTDYSEQGQQQGPFTFRFGFPGQGGGDDGGQDGQDNPFGFFGFPQQLQPAQPQLMRAEGSGFFISPDGYIVTNNHVVQGADKITVHTKDGRDLKAHLVGTDAATDLAVIKVDGGGYPYVSFEDRAMPRVGDWVVAVGNPFGLGGTATAGIVSALGRKDVADSNYVDYMQIDAPINRGNSGGPTFDAYGRVVGVNTAIYSPSGGSVGIGFDIPADVAARVSRELIEHGKVVRGYIGATVQAVTPEMSDSLGLHGRKGAIIADLTPGGPAEQAGLHPGDVVLALNGRPVDSADDLTRQVALVHPGQLARLDVLRDGRSMTIDVHSGLRPSEAELASNPERPYAGPGESGDVGQILGMRLEPNAHGGVTVAGVASDSDAADKGLTRGDVILQANGHRAASPSDVAAAVAQAKHEGRDEVLLMVAHNGRHVFVPLKVASGDAQG